MGLFSATLPQLVEELILPTLERPVRVTIGGCPLAWHANTTPLLNSQPSRCLNYRAGCLHMRQGALEASKPFNSVTDKQQSAGERNAAASSVKQRLVFVGQEAGKAFALRDLLRSGGLRPPTLIFVRDSQRAKQLHRWASRVAGESASCWHARGRGQWLSGGLAKKDTS